MGIGMTLDNFHTPFYTVRARLLTCILALLVIMSVQKALSGRHSEYYITLSHAVKSDLEASIRELLYPTAHILSKQFSALQRNFGLKFQVKLFIELEKFSFLDNRSIIIRQWFVSPATLILTANVIQKKLVEAFSKAVSHFDNFVQTGSGWTLREVSQLVLTVMRVNAFHGGCMQSIILPPSLKKTRAVCTLRSKRTARNNCFMNAVVVALCNCVRNPSRMNKTYKTLLKMLPQNYLIFPLLLKDVKKFEKKVPISVNVYGYDRVLFPLYISQSLDKKPFHVNLLLHKNHYFAIKNLARLVRRDLTVNRRKAFVCQNCLAFFVDKNKYSFHQDMCFGSKKQPMEMVDPQDKFMAFKNFSNLVPMSFVIYADLESLILKEIDVAKGKQISTREHRSLSWAAFTVCRDNPRFSSPKPVMYTGEDSLHKFLDYLEEEFERIQDIIRTVNYPILLSASDEQAFELATHCNMCRSAFVPESVTLRKVRDHSHLNGKYRQAICSRCNLTHARQKEKVVVIFHGLSNYDSHFIIQHLSRYHDKYLKVIPRTGERFLSFSVRDLVFKDSFEFLGESLATLVKNLHSKGKDHFHFVKQCFPAVHEQSLLFRKGVFPYNYVSSMDVLRDKQLPPKEAFFNDLTQTHISQEDYAQAQKVWSTFKCQTLQDYLEIYLLADVLLLADCFENFRSQCLDLYEIDPLHYFSNAHFTFDAFLRHSSCVIELFTDINMHMFISRGIRGGLSMVSGQRCSVANNKYLLNYDPTKPPVYILDLDCVNLYGYIMMMYLPVSDFHWCEPTDEMVQNILDTAAESRIGYILEVDLEYPSHLFQAHQDYPLAPHRKSIPFGKLSPFAQKLVNKHGLKHSTNTTKLMTTLEDKEKYVLHYRTLQLYVKLGLVLKKVHKVLSFVQEPLMKDYIQFNSEKRAAATNAFDVSYFKLLNNSLFGKTMERPDNKTIVKLVTTAKTYERNVSKLTFKNAKRINDDLVSLEMNHAVLKVNKPMFLGFTILDLAKMHMYDFHYRVMKPYFGDNLSLLYTDTDSLVYEIKGIEDIYLESFPKLAKYFDFSNYPSSHSLFSCENKKVPGLFKDEFGGKQIQAFIGLRSKMYCLKPDVDEKEIKLAKGVKKSVIEAQIKFNDYAHCLMDDLQLEHSFHAIQSRLHNVITSHQKKISLSSFDDKRFLVSPFFSLPYGHPKAQF